MRTDDELDIVRFALALHLRVDPDDIHEGQRLQADLSLERLDLVLVALRLEELDDTAEFPVAELAWCETVGDLVAVVGAWCRMAPGDRASTLPPPRPASSIRLVGEPACGDASHAEVSTACVSRLSFR